MEQPDTPEGLFGCRCCLCRISQVCCCIFNGRKTLRSQPLDNTLWASSFFFFVYTNLCSGTTCVVWIWVPILWAATLSTKHFYNCFVLSMFSPSPLWVDFLFIFFWIPCYLTNQAGPPIYFFSNICIYALNIKSLVHHVAVLVQSYQVHAMAFTLPLF